MAISDDKKPLNIQPVAWLVSSPYSNYYLHEGLIGNRLEKNHSLEPETRIFKSIKQGDIIAYFDFTSSCLLGLFTVCDKEESVGIFEKTEKNGKSWFLQDDIDWDPALIHYIKPYLKLQNKWIDLRRYIKDHKSDFSKEFLDYVNKVENEKPEDKVQKYICTALNPSDYNILKKIFETSQSAYLIETPNVLFQNSEEVSSLLEFYNSRATSFANLFVASVFGIVTLSAIVVSLSIGEFWRSIFSMIPFWLFVIAGAYTLYRYYFYAGIAEGIKTQGFLYTNTRTSRINGESKRCFRNAGLTGYVERKRRSKNGDFLRNRITKIPLTWIYGFAIAALFVFVYWNLFHLGYALNVIINTLRQLFG